MKVDRNPVTSGQRSKSFCDPTCLVFPITRELLQIYICYAAGVSGNIFLLFSKFWICSSAQRPWYWYYRVRAFLSCSSRLILYAVHLSPVLTTHAKYLPLSTFAFHQTFWPQYFSSYMASVCRAGIRFLLTAPGV